ncbi:3-hydroxybutyryl-CoA dehydrogenase [Streptomyces rubellomurinus subsp. indigoferus]|uniref:3-hydroxybutyryl-CoA dehydrogenase n=1 Tax=Streptomyces rubellomurinus (strain ATCC 31215) TaxID=359131 RepID=A0A0F2TF23_STRR3|nr:3-hydroxybutyryl-CoA dehydrogenase [Streptomyces rubellomurinus]KJS56700.1 3-hydroxybutyryl-CoA dehydrogenase [Streptomyces rubellomurinus subsp. indigoferus]KJS60332.1 3-hydroxybutyryl-CoA dehydrogenase [Streptomyces rubellomurinus]
MERPFPTVAVVGLGTMGAGVAVAVAKSGRRVIGIEAGEDSAARALARIEEATAHAVERERITAEERTALLARITVGHELAAAAEADLVIEEVPEQLELKREVFAELDRICPPSTVLATGTTALPVTRIAAATARPERVLGLHFFNPVHSMKLVEVVRTVLTSPQTAEDAAAFARDLGKEPVAAGDRAGFVVNGLLFAYLNQAAAMYESKYASREDIDAAMRLGCGLPMGPLALLDLIGIDTARTVLEAMYEQSRDRLHAPAPILGQLVAAGLLGRKTGRGFYAYEAPGSSKPVDAATGPARPKGPGREVRTVGVCGSGTMATGIVEVFAKAGHPVLLAARSQEKADRAKEQLARSLERSVAKGRMTAEQRDAALALVTPVGQYAELADVDLVVEAVAEDLAVKRELFATLDKVVRPGAVLATTTSSLPVISCATATSRPQDVIGMHFFNPAPAMKLVEVVSTVLTAPEVTATVLELTAKVRKHPVECGDRAGFIVNALLFPYLNDAVRMLQEHYATVDDIDTAMKLGCGYPMGPFELLDVVGLDVSLAIERVLHQEFREPGLAAAPLLEHLVAAGCLGRKTGRGFRDHARR